MSIFGSKLFLGWFFSKTALVSWTPLLQLSGPPGGLLALCVMIATRKGNKWRQTRFDNSAAFATYSSGRKSARTFSIVEAASSAQFRFCGIFIRFCSEFHNCSLVLFAKITKVFILKSSCFKNSPKTFKTFLRQLPVHCSVSCLEFSIQFHNKLKDRHDDCKA